MKQGAAIKYYDLLLSILNVLVDFLCCFYKHIFHTVTSAEMKSEREAERLGRQHY